MNSKHVRRRGHAGIELIDLPDEPAGRLDTLPESAPDHDPGRARRQVRSQRLKFAAAAVTALAALVVAWQLIPTPPASHDANKPVPPPITRPGDARGNPHPDPSNNASIKATNAAGTDAMGSLGATSGDCDLTGLRDAYPDAEAIGTGIRSAIVDHLDRRDQHVESPSGQLNCVWPNGTDQRELELVLTWTSRAYKGLIIVNVANFKDPTMTGCGTGWSCAPASSKRVHARSARVIRDTGDRGFGVVVERKDRQYVSIMAGAMPQTNNDIDPTRSLNHFPFAAKKLLAVAVDPRVHLDSMITPPH